ncbi:MAG: hypothetical protein EBT20_05655, partial [Alphaproteobacteria bacterium]|nr:hypothetical protein [Alphaproteobacteria bacterium]
NAIPIECRGCHDARTHLVDQVEHFIVAGIFILVGLLVWKITTGSDSSVSNPWNNVELALPLDEEIVNMASHRRHVDILVRKADGQQELRRVHADGRVDILFKILPE